jgi:predicted PurR-regulated permease PerM
MIGKASPMTKYLIVSAALVISVSGLKIAGPLLVPFFLAVFIAMILSPLLTWLKNHRMPGGAAVLLVVVSVLLVGLLVGSVISLSVDNFRQDMPFYSARLSSIGNVVQQWLSTRGINIDAQRWQGNFDPSAVMKLVGNTLASFGNVMINTVMILLTVFFILSESTGFSDKLRLAQGEHSSQEWLKKISDSVHSYIAIKAAISFMTGLLIFI